MTLVLGGLRITTPMPKIQEMVNAEAIRVLNSRVPRVVSDIEAGIAHGLKHVLVNNDEYESLTTGGDLAQHFGLEKSQAITKLDNIIDTIIGSIQVKFKRFQNRTGTIQGGITVSAIKDDFIDIISIPAGQVVTDKGQSLPWLEWLLIEGDRIIITDFEIQMGPSPYSRAGDAIMIPKKAGVWRVPPQFSGTQTNNWITRAVDDASTFLESLFISSFRHNLMKALP
jgi:hypothetical protein